MASVDHPAAGSTSSRARRTLIHPFSDPSSPPLPPLPPQAQKRESRQPPPSSEARNPVAPPPKPSAPPVQRKSSRSSLFNLFSRPKVEKARGHHEGGGLATILEPPPPSQSQPTSQLQARPQPQTQSQPQPSSQSPQPPRPPPPYRPSPQLVAPTQSNQPNPLIRIAAANAPYEPRRMPSQSRLKPLKGSVAKRSVNWDPPPLFQAYPQAIKHATLQSSIASAEAVLKASQQQRNRRPYSVLQDRMDSRTRLELAGSPDAEAEEEAKRPERARLTSKRLSSAIAINMPEMTKKIYVLVTSGYVLQYSGEGAFDRLPEKVLPLGPESAAFACDLIPGKHWVLQISQVANEDGSVASGQSRSLLAKLRLQNASARRHASNFLLVLESAEQMDSWLTAVRKEIDALGGSTRKDEAEMRSMKSDRTAEAAGQEVPGHRYLVTRDTKRFSAAFSVDAPSVVSSTDSPRMVASDWDRQAGRVLPGGLNLREPDTSSNRSSRRTSVRQSIEVASPTSTVLSGEMPQLAHLPAGSRLSIMSSGTVGSGTGTLATSRGSSPSGSPRSEAFPKPELDAPPTAASVAARTLNLHRPFPRSGTTTPNSYKRRSMHSLPTTNEDEVAMHEGSGEVAIAITSPVACSTPVISTPIIQPPPEESQSGQNSPESITMSARRTRSPRPQSVVSPINRSMPKYRSSSLPPPQIPLPPLPAEATRLEKARPQSIVGGLPSGMMLAMHSTRRTPSPIPPTIAENAVDDKPGSPSKSDARQPVLGDISNNTFRLSRRLDRTEKRAPNFSLPTLPTYEHSATRIIRSASTTFGSAAFQATPGTALSRPPSSARMSFRPVPIRTGDGNVPRRHSSGLPPPLPLAVSVSNASTPMRSQPSPPSMRDQQPKALKRPTSMQIRADRTPFLSAARPTSRSASLGSASFSTMSSPASKPESLSSASSAASSASSTSPPRPTRLTSFDILAPPPYAQLKVQRSMPALPPVGPPPDMPLPAPPSVQTASRPIAV